MVFLSDLGCGVRHLRDSNSFATQSVEITFYFESSFQKEENWFEHQQDIKISFVLASEMVITAVQKSGVFVNGSFQSKLRLQQRIWFVLFGGLIAPTRSLLPIVDFHFSHVRF
ncbi:hypothetical protein MKW98_010942 [Papaver atlanticum]|uniref:Uncharacterized protein n=1 Tax=Papaver atlanticum TaxID=357466 RepID=A0AAD4SNG9_9MAGN|nr:hypothetical protein MKW98_010942 [Papaver atlanticum]